MGDIHFVWGERNDDELGAYWPSKNWVLWSSVGLRVRVGFICSTCQVQYEDQVVQVPVQKQVHVPMVQTVQKHIEIPQIEYQDEIVEVPVQWLANLLQICGEQIGWKLPQELK